MQHGVEEREQPEQPAKRDQPVDARRTSNRRDAQRQQQQIQCGLAEDVQEFLHGVRAERQAMEPNDAQDDQRERREARAP